MQQVIKKIALVIFIALSSCNNDLPNVLVIGDSISIGYTPYIKRQMLFTANVKHIGENARYSTYGVGRLDAWLEGRNPDIILFNWGLWDLVYRLPTDQGYGEKNKMNGFQQTNIYEYEKNLESILYRLKETQARLIFVTTTYVPIEEPGMYTADVIKYNRVAKKVMERNKVEVIDIYLISKKTHLRYGVGLNNVHYTKRGYRELGVYISDILRNKL